MNNGKKIGFTVCAAAVASVLAAGLSGCDDGKKGVPETKPAVGAQTDAAQPAAENPATAKPKDHPAH